MDPNPATTPLVSPLEPPPAASTFNIPLVVILFVFVLMGAAGVFSGYKLANPAGSKTSASSVNSPAGSKTVNSVTEVGSTDTKTFSDTATGVLDKGGIGGEGTHHLTRPGGVSQTVYLISSVVDLDQFVGKTVQVFGQTVKGQKAAWLMDVGRVKLTE